MLSYLFAVLAACANATSSVMQRKANRQVPQRENLSIRLIWSLLHRPAWFAGVAAVTAGFLLQAAALGNGKISVVEPILVLELPLALILASRVFGSRLRSREWGSALAMTAALAGLLYVLSPSGGRPGNVALYTWLIAIGVNLALVGALVAWGRRGPAGTGPTGGSSAHQAAVLGVAAGASFGLTAALIKGMTQAFSQGFTVLLTSWQLYAMIAAGALSMFLVQSAMNAGRLLAAQPGLTLADPVVSIMWGVFVFREQIRSGWFLALAGICGAGIVATVITLAHSPLLSGESGSREETRFRGRGEPANERQAMRRQRQLTCAVPSRWPGGPGRMTRPHDECHMTSAT